MEYQISDIRAGTYVRWCMEYQISDTRAGTHVRWRMEYRQSLLLTGGDVYHI